MPGYELQLTVRYPRRLPEEPFDFWRWVILDSLRRSLLRLDFSGDSVRCGGGFRDALYVSYRDHFTGFDDWSHLTYGRPDGRMRRIRLRSRLPAHRTVFSRPIPTAVFLVINGLVLLCADVLRRGESRASPRPPRRNPRRAPGTARSIPRGAS